MMSMRRCAALLAILPYIIGCEAGTEGPLTADGAVLHLEEHLADAVVSGSQIPADVVRSVDWNADDLLAHWRATGSEGRNRRLAEEPGIISAGGGALRLTADARHSNDRGAYSVLVTTPVDGWIASEWSHFVVRARTTDPVNGVAVAVGTDEEIRFTGTSVISDGQVHTYRLDVPQRWARAGSFDWIGIAFLAEGPATLEIPTISPG